MPPRPAFSLIFRLCCVTAITFWASGCQPARAADRLPATGGLMQIEGSAGGGLTPWALIAGLGTDRQLGGSVGCTRVQPADFTLDSCGIAGGVDDRLELSLAGQRFGLGSTAPGQSIRQQILGAKLRLIGDAVYDQDLLLPQIAAGIQWKHNSDFGAIPRTLGARRASGTDFYLAATKVWLAGPLGRGWVADLTLRASEANQLGLLGFGGDRGGYHLLAEGSLGVFLSDEVIAGAEYRQKPDNLAIFREDDFKDLFVAVVPVKWLSLTAAWVDLGNIANRRAQRGWYLSVQLSR